MAAHHVAFKLAAIFAGIATGGSVRAGVVPISRHSEVWVKGNADGQRYADSKSTDLLENWSKTVDGYARGTEDDFVTGSAALGSAFEFTGLSLTKIAVDIGADFAMRGGSGASASAFEMKFKITDTPVHFQALGTVICLPGNAGDCRLVDSSRGSVVFDFSSINRSDPLIEFDKLGVLQPGLYDLSAGAITQLPDPLSSITTLHATLEFSPADAAVAIPLPAGWVQGLWFAFLISMAWGFKRFTQTA